MKIKLSRSQWETVGKKAGWIKEAKIFWNKANELDLYKQKGEAKLTESKQDSDVYMTTDKSTKYIDYRKSGGDVGAEMLCNCGSGLSHFPDYDARGIPTGMACQKCKEKKREKFRPEIFTNPSYHADEPIEPEDY